MADWSTPGAADNSSAPVAPGDEPYVPAAAPAGGGWSTPGAASGSAGGGWSTPGAAPQAAAAPTGGHKGVLSQIGGILNPFNMVKGIVHLASDVGHSPFTAADALAGKQSGPNKGEKGLHVFAQEAPTLYQAGRGLEHTVQGAPDLAINLAKGEGVENSLYGRDIHEQGVLPWAVQQVGNVAMAAGGIGALGKAAGFGNLAEAAGAEGLAGKAAGFAEKAGGVGADTIKTAADAQAAAEAARTASNASMAAEYDSAASSLQRAADARAAAAARGTMGRAAENVTAGAKTVSHFGNQVANAPAEIYTKGIPKLLNAIPGVDTAAAAARVGETVSKIPGVQAAKESLAAGRTMRDLYRQNVTAEGERLAQPVHAATAEIQRLFKGNSDAETAAYLARSGDAANVVRHLAGLSDADIQAALDATPGYAGQVTPPAVRKAAGFLDGTLPADEAAKIAQAHQIMEAKVYGPKAERHVAGFGDKEPMNPVKQAGREANVAGQPAPMAVDQLTEKLTAPLDKRLSEIEAEAADLRQRNLDPQEGGLTDAQKKQLAKDEAKAQALRQQVAREEARASRTATAHESAAGRVIASDQARISNIAGGARERLEGLRTGAAEAKAGTLADQAAQAAEATNNEVSRLRSTALSNANTADPGWYLEQVGPAGETRAQLLNQADEIEGRGRGSAAGLRAQAEQVEPTKAPGAGKIQAQTNRKVSVANARTAGESSATERMSAGEAGRQESALQAAQRRLAAHEETAGSRADRMKNDAAVRAFKADQRRLGVLADRRDSLAAERAAAVEGAPNATSVQAPQTRSVLSHATGAAGVLRARAAELEATDPAMAAHLRQAADRMPTSAAGLSETPGYIAGGESPEQPGGTGQGGPRIRSRQKTGSERLREGDVAPLNAEGQAKQVVQDLSGRARNNLPRMVQSELGSTAGAVAKESGLEGAALAAHLKEQGYTAWDPEGTGGKLPDHRVTADSPVVPTKILDKYQKWAPSKEPGALSKAAHMINNARIIKLLSTGFPLHKMGADTLLDQAIAGVSPIDLAKGIPGAIRDIRAKNLPADVGIQQARPIVPGETLGAKLKNVPEHIKAKGMTPFRMIDTANRDIVNKTLLERGYSPQTAAEVTRAAAGDLQHMSPTEKAAGRAVVTYYPWQRHLADVAKNVVVAHPAGLSEAATIAQADERGHPGQQPQRGELADFMNPMGNFVLAPGGDAAGRIQQQLNPLLQLGAGALAGVNLRKGEPLTTPGHPFGATGPTGPLITQPGNLAGFGLHTLVPQVGQIQDVLHGAKGGAGYIPYRQDTGQPEAKKGAVQAQPGTTKLDAVARLIGFPHAEKAPPPKKAKKR